MWLCQSNMAKGLAMKKRIMAGHRGVAKRKAHKVDNLLVSVKAGGQADASKLAQLRWSLQEKLDTLKRPDGKMLVLFDNEGELTEEIEQATDFLQSRHLRSYGKDSRAQQCHAHYDVYAWSCNRIRSPVGSGSYTCQYSGEAAQVVPAVL